MYTFIRAVPVKDLLTTQTPILVLCFFIAESFYKFHSFTLECIAFLLTWFVLDSILSFIHSKWR